MSDRLQEIKAALEAGNEDEWWPLDEMYHLTPAQHAFYTAVPETVAWLIAEVESLRVERDTARTEVERVKEIHCKTVDEVTTLTFDLLAAVARAETAEAEVERDTRTLRAQQNGLVKQGDAVRELQARVAALLEENTSYKDALQELLDATACASLGIRLGGAGGGVLSMPEWQDDARRIDKARTAAVAALAPVVTAGPTLHAYGSDDAGRLADIAATPEPGGPEA